MNHYVYKITNLLNNKKYIGKRSCKCLIKDDKYMGSGVLMKKALRKYGKDNFSKEILKICDNENEAFKWESFYIESIKAYERDDYYNISAGGNGGFAVFAGKTEEELLLWKQRMSEARKGRTITEEWISKIVKTRKDNGVGVGEKNPMYGRTGKNSPVAKHTYMISLEGEILKEFECLRDINEYLNINKSFTYISKKCLSKKGGAYGYLWLFSEDYHKMINNNTFDNWVSTNAKKVTQNIKNNNYRNNYSVYQLDINTLKVIKEFNSIKEASLESGVRIRSIIRNCKHDCNTAEGYSWILVSEYNNISYDELKKTLFSKKI